MLLTKKMKIYISALIAVSFFLVMQSVRSQASDPPGMAWDRHIGNDNASYEIVGLASFSNGAVVIGTEVPAGAENGIAKLWKINDQGELIKEFSIVYAHNGQGVAALVSGCISVSEDEDMLVVFEAEKGKPYLAKIRANGRQVFQRPLFRPSDDEMSFNKIIRSSSYGYYLIGRRASKAYVVLIDGDGSMKWEKDFEFPASATFVDGLSSGDGAVLVANFGIYYRPIGDCHVSIITIDESGSKLSENTFEGRNGRISQKGDGDSLIVYDKSDLKDSKQKTWTQKVFIATMHPDLHVSKENSVLSIERGMGRFEISDFPGGNILITGPKQNQFWVARINGDGDKMWEFFDEKNIRRMSHAYYLSRDASGAFIAYSAYREDESGYPRNQIGLLRLSSEPVSTT